MNGEEPTFYPPAVDGNDPVASVPIPASEAVSAPETVPTPPAPSPNPLRQQLLEQFESWLDTMLADEQVPEGLSPEILAELGLAGDAQAGDRHCDLYALFSSLTTLSGEIRLQGRTFKQLTDALAPLADVPARLGELSLAQRQATQAIEQFGDDLQQSAADESTLPASKEVLAVVFDLYDRLDRALAIFDQSVQSLSGVANPGWFQRMVGGHTIAAQAAKATEAIRTGYQLTLSRLEGALAQWDIQRIDSLGQMFDPTLMTAFDVQASADDPDGTVLEVYRNGYTHHGQVLMTAQVKVAKS